ncbi:MAG: MFS transporter [Dehalococcoidia bacterium]|nr:MFS transporter [Dehalococcoidia bacterium]
MTFTTSAVYAIVEAGLNPFQLLLIGAVLEGSVLIAEVPTGIVADAYSRRRSVIIGYAILAVGFFIWGSVPNLAMILIAQVFWAVGFAFTSGAQEAWIADEVGDDAAGPIFLRAAQVGQIAAFIGIFVGVSLATVNLHLPFMISGLLFLLLAVFLFLAMGERNFRPAGSVGGVFGSLSGTVRSGLRVIRGRTVLVFSLAVAAIFGASSEAFDRLWPAHLLEQVDLPELAGLDPLVWFAVIAAGGLLLGVGITELAGRAGAVTTRSGPTRALVVLNLMLFAALLVFAFTSSLAGLVIAYWVVTALRRASNPVFLAWINRGLAPSVRATVLSMHSQADALGQVTFGPGFGALATIRSIRFGLGVGAVVLLPALGLLLAARNRTTESSREESGD